MTVLGIDHVQVAMPPERETEARSFYGGVLGFEEMVKPPELAARGGVWFVSGEVHVHLGIDEGFEASAKAHTGFLVDDLTEMMGRFKAAGLAVERGLDHRGRARVYVRDPFGNRLEFVEAAGA